jgi:hypothetical protein
LQELEKAEGGDDGCFYDVGGGDQHLKVTHLQVEISEHSAAVEPTRQVTHVGERILIISGLDIEAAEAVLPDSGVHRYFAQI